MQICIVLLCCIDEFIYLFIFRCVGWVAVFFQMSKTFMLRLFNAEWSLSLNTGWRSGTCCSWQQMAVWFARWRITSIAVDANGCWIEWGHWGADTVPHPCPISAKQHMLSQWLWQKYRDVVLFIYISIFYFILSPLRTAVPLVFPLIGLGGSQSHRHFSKLHYLVAQSNFHRLRRSHSLPLLGVHTICAWQHPVGSARWCLSLSYPVCSIITRWFTWPRRVFIAHTDWLLLTCHCLLHLKLSLKLNIKKYLLTFSLKVCCIKQYKCIYKALRCVKWCLKCLLRAILRHYALNAFRVQF